MTIAFETSGNAYAATFNNSTPCVVSGLTIADGSFIFAFISSTPAAADVSLPAGFTEIESIDFGSSESLVAGYKIASSESGSYSFTTTATSSNKAYATIHSYTGANTSNPFDAYYVRASHYQELVGDATPTPLPITTNYDNSLILLVGACVNDGTASWMTYTAPSGYTLRQKSGPAYAAGHGVADKLLATAGTETPGDWTFAIGIAVESGTFTFAISEAGTNIGISGIGILPPTGWDTVDYVETVIPTDSILYYAGGQDDTSTASATVMTDSAASFTVNAFIGFKIRNTSDGSEGIITANTATTVAATLSGGTDNNWDSGDYYEIVMNMTDGDQIVYETDTNLGGTVTISSSGVPTITGIEGTHTFNVKFREASTGEVSSTVTITGNIV